jgi:large subunit ribosomal protein L10
MPAPRKVTQVEAVSEKLKRAQSLVITDYRGLTVAQMQELRRKLSADGVEYLVVKNTLARRAAEDSGLEELKPELVGPVALAIGYDEPITPARVVNDYIKQTRRLVIKSGLLGRQLLDAETVKRLAELPGRDALLGQLAGTLNHSVAQLAGALKSVVQKLANGLEAYRVKLDAASAASAPVEAEPAAEPAPEVATEAPTAGSAPPDTAPEAVEPEAPGAAAEEQPAAEAVTETPATETTETETTETVTTETETTETPAEEKE